MNDKPTPGAGDVEIELDGETVVLKPSLDACITISRAGGGLYGQNTLTDRIARADFDAMAAVIRAGLGLTGNAVKNLDGQIYRTGLVNLIGPLTRFVMIVGNGGRPRPKDAEDGDDSGNGAGAAGE